MKQNETDFQHPSTRDQIRFYSLVAIAGILMVVAYQFGSSSYYLGWFAFFISAFSVAGNDAVQTIGTFIESKKVVHWISKLIVLGGDHRRHFFRYLDLERFPDSFRAFGKFSRSSKIQSHTTFSSIDSSRNHPTEISYFHHLFNLGTFQRK